MCSTRIKQMHKKPTKLHLHNSLVSATQALHSCCEQVKKKNWFFQVQRLYFVSGTGNPLGEVSSVPCFTCYGDAVNWQEKKKIDWTQRDKTKFGLLMYAFCPLTVFCCFNLCCAGFAHSTRHTANQLCRIQLCYWQMPACRSFLFSFIAGVNLILDECVRISFLSSSSPTRAHKDAIRQRYQRTGANEVSRLLKTPASLHKVHVLSHFGICKK